MIKVLFIVNEKFVNNIESLYYRLLNDDNFEIIVGACESCATAYKIMESSSDIAEYFIENGIPCIDLFDSDKNSYRDVAEFKPDYIFVSTPYDIYRPKEYSSDNLSLIGKLCDIEYGTNILANLADMPFFKDNMFYKNVYFHFIGNNLPHYLSEKVEKIDVEKSFVPVGCLKVEKFLNRNVAIDNNFVGGWNKIFAERPEAYRIVWKPRWTSENPENLFRDLEVFSEFLNLYSNVQVILLEHPFLQSKLVELGLIENYRKFIDGSNIVTYKDSDFLDVVMESDCLICEPTSLAAEYSITGNPIILMHCDYSELNSMGRSIIDERNVCKTMIETCKILDHLLKEKQMRRRTEKSYVNSSFYEDSTGMIPSERIVKILKNDYEHNPNENYFRIKAQERYRDMEIVEKILVNGYYTDGLVEPNTIVMKNTLLAVGNWYQEIENLRKLKAKQRIEVKKKFRSFFRL